MMHALFPLEDEAVAEEAANDGVGGRRGGYIAKFFVLCMWLGPAWGRGEVAS